MKRNETSARGASKHAPVKNAGSRRLRSLTAAAFIVMTGIGLAWHTGWGTLSSFGIGSIAEVCPLGALEAMLADRTFLPQAFFGLGVLFENRGLHAVCVRILHLRRKGRRSRVD